MLEIGFESSLLTSVASSSGGAVAAGPAGDGLGTVYAVASDPQQNITPHAAKKMPTYRAP
jgi:hypothetical protein